jgi:O-antigen/teichoic acid export membrane protein
MTNSPYSRVALQYSVMKLLSGKVVSALLTFAILLWLVRLMPVTEYGAYIILVAGMELGFALSGLGLPWLAARYLPEYRIHASGADLAEICRQLLIWNALTLLIFITLFALLLDSYLDWVGLGFIRTSAQIYLAVMLVEGLGRFLRVTVMESLMLQGGAGSCTVLRQLCFLILIAILELTDHGTLLWVACAELIASVFGMVAALIILWRHLKVLHDKTRRPEWLIPALSTQWHIAGSMYSAQLLTLAYSPQVFVNLIQRSLGVEAAALFGFLRTLQEQIARYLPASLLLSIIRPKLVASYIEGGGMAELSRNANFAGKISLFILMPVIALTALTGNSVVAGLSGSKFTDSGWLLFGLMLVLVPLSQRQLTESVAVISGHARLCTWAAAVGLIVLPLMWGMLQMGLGLWAAVIATFVGHLLFNSVVVVMLSKRDGYRTDWEGFLKLMLSVLTAYGASALLGIEDSEAWVSPGLLMILQCLMIVIIYLTIIWWIKAFVAGERSHISTFLKNKIFIW